MTIDNEDQVIEEEIILDNNEEETTETDPVDSNEEVSNEPATIRDEDNEEDEDDRVVTIGEPESEEESKDEEHQEAPGWVKKVRKSNRRLESENKQLKRKLEELQKPTEEKVELGEKPTLESCEYDDKKYEEELISYYERKRKVEEQQVIQQKTVEEQNQKWQTKQNKYVESRKSHNFKDFSETEDLVGNTLSVAQQQIIVQGADDSALVVYALGKNPKKLEELSSIQDPVEFAFTVAKLESQLKVTNRKAPKPERKVSGGKAGGISGNGDSTLERLREEAAKTGDYTKVTAYKRQLRKG